MVSLKAVKKFPAKIFGKFAEESLSQFKPLRSALKRSNTKILLRTYVSIIFFVTLVAVLGSLAGSFYLFSSILGYGLGKTLTATLAVTVLGGGATFGALYLYPIQKTRSRRRNIQRNLPFAINHMSAIASSKVPPYVIFKLLTGFEEYGEISKEAERVVRNVDVFGQDITTAIDQVAQTTPSDDLRNLLNGIHTTIQTGGNLKQFFNIQADEAMAEYKRNREEFMETLSTYADFYTAVLIAAPLFLVALLAIMNMIGGRIAGMSIEQVMKIGIYGIIPATNTIFVLFIHLTQPQR